MTSTHSARTTTRTLRTPHADLAVDVHGPLPAPDGRPPLLLVGAPMDASGFATLVSLLPDRTVVTHDPRGLGRSTRSDGRDDHTPEQYVEDLWAVVQAVGGGPVDVFASSGGAVTALELLRRRPGVVGTLVAHEPPVLSVLPDAERAFAAERAVQEVYHARGWGHGMAAFIALTSWSGELTDEFAARPLPDPRAFGLPAGDDGTRTDPLLSGTSNAVTAYRPDVEAVRSSGARVVVAVGRESLGFLTGRTSQALAQQLGVEPVVFPGGHSGFMGGEFGQTGEPEEFADRLRAVLAG